MVVENALYAYIQYLYAYNKLLHGIHESRNTSCLIAVPLGLVAECSGCKCLVKGAIAETL